MRVSPSKLKTWMKCQQQAAFKYVDKLSDDRVNAAAVFGTCMHEVMERISLDEDFDEAAAFVEMWDASLETINDWPNRTSPTSYRDKGLKQIAKFLEYKEKVNYTVIGTEVAFCVKFGDHELVGFIDCLAVDHEARLIRILDWKTGWRPNADNLALDIQFTGYYWAVRQPEFWLGNPDAKENDPFGGGFENGADLYEEYKDYAIEAVWFDATKGKEYNVGPRGTADIVRMYRCVETMEKAFEAEIYVPDISGTNCKFCSFTEECTYYLNPEQLGKGLE